MGNIADQIKKNKLVNILLESIGDGIFILNNKGSIIAWNPAMEKITGFKQSEVLNQNCTMLNFNHCFGKDCPTGYQDCGIFEYGKVAPTECMLRHKDGHEINVTKNARIILDNNQKILGIIEAVTDLTELKNTRLKMEEATRRLSELNRLHGIIGKSQVMQNVFSFIKASAASDVTILIQGESGTGKELVASAIHNISQRRDKPFVIVNCSALSESLLESELFGHVKGAFTGAIKSRSGRFEEADTGTIFLDEIGEISPFIQVKLLRVLQQKEIERVGESSKRNIDIRVITATNKDLKTLVQQGNFREDLYYRLKVFPIYLPLLNSRKEDIPLLVNHFIGINNKLTKNKVKGISNPALRSIMDYPWPGNVRELANAIEHAFVLCSGREIDIHDLPVEIRNFDPYAHDLNSPVIKAPVTTIPLTPLVRPSLSKEKLITLLTQCKWNKAEVARQTGFSRAAIWKYMKKWNIPTQPGKK